jgi:DNA-directed RNA polymerase subunit F
MEDYLNQFTTLSTEENKKLVDELTKLDIPRLRGTHIIKIADLIPETVDDIKVILQGYALTVTTDNMKKIVGVTSKFASK